MIPTVCNEVLQEKKNVVMPMSPPEIPIRTGLGLNQGLRGETYAWHTLLSKIAHDSQAYSSKALIKKAVLRDQ